MPLFAVPLWGGGTICVPGSSRLRTDQESAMGEPSVGAPPSERLVEDRLDSWKEIAVYLNRDVTTVQRWEKREGMPVHRHLHDKMGSVYASRAELDAWALGRNLRSASENGSSASATNPVPEAQPVIEQPRAGRGFVLPLMVAV